MRYQIHITILFSHLFKPIFFQLVPWPDFHPSGLIPVVPGLDRSGDLLCHGPYANHGVLIVLLDIPWYRLVYPIFFWGYPKILGKFCNMSRSPE